MRIHIIVMIPFRGTCMHLMSVIIGEFDRSIPIIIGTVVVVVVVVDVNITVIVISKDTIACTRMDQGGKVGLMPTTMTTIHGHADHGNTRNSNKNYQEMLRLPSIIIVIIFIFLKGNDATVLFLQNDVVLRIEIEEFAVRAVKMLTANTPGVRVLLIDRKIARCDLRGDEVGLALAAVGAQVYVRLRQVQSAVAVFGVPVSAHVPCQRPVDGVGHVTRTGARPVRQRIARLAGQLTAVRRSAIGVVRVGRSVVIGHAPFDGDLAPDPPESVGTRARLHHDAGLGKVLPILDRSGDVHARTPILAFQIAGEVVLRLHEFTNLLVQFPVFDIVPDVRWHVAQFEGRC